LLSPIAVAPHPAASKPLSAEEFTSTMAPFAPFESAPLVAVGVSGGADSLALVLLADAWARARGGRVVALTVDHRLRPESAGEAQRVATWLAARGIDHEILVRKGAAPARNVEAAARAARYALLEEWCRSRSCLHLLLAHHLEDQGETLLLRLGRGSGVDGLSSMPSMLELAHCRVLRPLLGVPRDRLAALLVAEGQAWIEDPSNDDPRFARTRVRRLRGALAQEGLSPLRLAATARRLARSRAVLDEATDRRLAAAVRLDPAGFALADPAILLAAPEDIALRALARLLAVVGGSEHPPRLERLERLLSRLRHKGGSGATLAGCRLLNRSAGLLLCREPAATAAPVSLPPGSSVRWDRRFTVRLRPDAPPGLLVGALGPAETGRLARLVSAPEVPAAARPALPALQDLEGVRLVPHLRFMRDGDLAGEGEWLTIDFRPIRMLTRSGFTVV
jgi:tRNA(Ile)-lysidine synthase